jgi:predicted DNA-binding transcriptional regulator AlpA
MQKKRPVRLLTPRHLARKVQRSEDTLARWRRERRGPPYIRLGNRVVYDEEAVDAWLMSLQIEPVSETASSPHGTFERDEVDPGPTPEHIAARPSSLRRSPRRAAG